MTQPKLHGGEALAENAMLPPLIAASADYQSHNTSNVVLYLQQHCSESELAHLQTHTTHSDWTDLDQNMTTTNA